MKPFLISNLKFGIPRQRRGRNGFTLIEIMVATAVMIVLVGLVVQITSQVLNVWNRSSGKLAANAEARVAMQLITQDLETAVFRNNGLEWLRAEKSDVNFLSGYTEQTTTLKLFSPALDRPDGPGDICAIGYLLDFRNAVTGTQTGDQTFVLYRNVVDAQTTFNSLMGSGNQDSLTGGEWSDASIVGLTPVGSNYLCANIVQFVIDFYVEGDPDPVANTSVIYGGNSATVGPNTALPQPLAYADITLVVISDEGAKLLQNIDKIPETAEEVVEQHSETFTRRVNFMSRPL